MQNPQSLPAALRDAVIHVAGVNADQAGYDTLLAFARNSTVTNDRLRYYYAVASAHEPILARATLALTLTDELQGTIIDRVINTVASSGEQPELAWDFVQSHLDALPPNRDPRSATPSFRNS